MLVKDLIAKLQKCDPNMEVLAADNDGWYYNNNNVRTAFISEDGREMNKGKKTDLCVVII